MMAMTGVRGLSMTPPSISSSRGISLPATAGSRCATPSVDAWARCAVPKASLTNTSPNAASSLANAGSLASSPGSNRTFSSMPTSPSRKEATMLWALSPTTSDASRTSASSRLLSLAAMGPRRAPSSIRPLGRPRWVTMTTRAPRDRSASMVGTASRIRRSSTTAPSRIGTLKSSRRRTRLPWTSMSSMVSLFSASILEPLQPGRDQIDQVDDAAGIAPFVVVPGEHLDGVIAEHHGRRRVEDRRVRVVEEVHRHQLLIAHREDALELPTRRLAHLGVHVLGGRALGERRGEIDEADIGHWNTQRHPVEPALQFGDHQGHCLGGAGGGGDDGEGGGAGTALVLVGGVEDDLVLGVGVHGGHEAGLDAERVVEHLGDGRQAVGGAGGVGDDVVRGGVVHRVVDTDADREVLVLRGGGDHHLARSGFEVSPRALRVAEETGRLDDDVHAEISPWKPLGIALREHLEHVAVNGDAVSIGSNRARETAEHTVVLEEVSEHLRCGDVVDRDDLEVGGALSGGAQHVSTDPAEAVDANSHAHARQPPARGSSPVR